MNEIGRIPSRPQAPVLKRFRSSGGDHILIVPHSRVYDVPVELAAELDANPGEADRIAALLGETAEVEAALDLVVAPPPQSISLNVSSACNLACGYCYADQGSFGGRQKESMSSATAFAAVDRLLAESDADHPVTIGFLGGEPFLNRSLVHAVVAYARERAHHRNMDVRFSITTNGLAMTPLDVELMRVNRFAVTVSVDGGASVQDAQRPDLKGRATFARLAQRIAPLLADPGLAQVAARVTVQSGKLDLASRLRDIWSMGFREAGVAPLRTAADGSNLATGEWRAYLGELVDVSGAELERARSGKSIRLTNLAVALKQIHDGASSPYPCGAGGGYFSVGATGRWYACHRAIGEAEFELGDSGGLSAERRKTFLIQRHVHGQTPCNSCWARYLCSGGCHQEAKARTEAGCEFIRDWLEFCLVAYCELLEQWPDYFIRGHQQRSST